MNLEQGAAVGVPVFAALAAPGPQQAQANLAAVVQVRVEADLGRWGGGGEGGAGL